jgi:hypothetical protein
MNIRKFTTPLAALFVLILSVSVFADTIRLKNGTVIRGEVVGFQDQQFIVLIGDGTRGRRSRMMLYMEDVESIEFEGRANVQTTGDTTRDARDNTTTNVSPTPSATPERTNTSSTPPDTTPSNTTEEPRRTDSQPPAQTTPDTTNSSLPYQLRVRVRGDNAANGWTNSGLVVRRGQRVRISASGRVVLGAGRTSTPAGLQTVADPGKLMRNEPTGGLIAVIGNDNDDFIFVGNSHEFIAQRDGVLFLGVNEGDLSDNTGGYDATIETDGR